MFAKKPDLNDPNKTTWERILTLTPVLLTVVSTLLAGLSTSEMTQAQYYRALAAQQQSKVSDEWNFFQVKRIRGTDMELTVDLLTGLGAPGPVETADLQATADLLVAALDRLPSECTALQAALTAAQAELGPLFGPSQATAQRLAQAVQTLQPLAAQQQKQLADLLQQSVAAPALQHLRAASVPTTTDQPVAPQFDPIRRAVRERQSDAEIAGLLAAVKPAELHDALTVAYGNASRFNQACEPSNQFLARLSQLMTAQVKLIRTLDRLLLTFTAIRLVDLQQPKQMEVARCFLAIRDRIEPLRNLIDQRHNDVKAALHSYTARRYDREARYNQAAAEVYELLVRTSSLTSERHRQRSRNLFYGMLAAQMGVTVASLALAVRFKSLLWTLAGLAGLTAIAFGGYIYWFT